MPIIQFNLMEGRTIEQKKRLAEKVTDRDHGHDPRPAHHRQVADAIHMH